MPGEGQFRGRGGEDAGVRGGRSISRQVDEYRFAVTQFGGDALPFTGGHGGRVHHAERIAEVASRIGEHPQHSHVDGHMSTVRPLSQVALRSSASNASSTATRVSSEPVTARPDSPLRRRSRSASWSYLAGSVESMNFSTTSTKRSGGSS